LASLVQNNSELALRKINITNWKSPVARQFSINSLPHVKVYNEDGTLEGQGSWDVIKALQSGGAMPSGGGSLLSYVPYAVLLAGLGFYLFGKSSRRAV
jgi:hypothetical protein